MSSKTPKNDAGNLSRALVTGRPAPGSMGTLTLDVEKYQRELDRSDLSEDEKRAVIEALWQVVTCFVDLGFGVHPLQQACGQDEIVPSEILTTPPMW